MADTHFNAPGSRHPMLMLDRVLNHSACILAAVIIAFFSLELLTRPLLRGPLVSTHQAWIEGGVFILAMVVLLMAIFARQVSYLLVAALIFCQSYFGAGLLGWQIMQPHLLIHYAPGYLIEQWLLGITLFLVVHALFRLRLLSFAYLIPVQRFLYYGAWLWLPMAWFMPPSWFWAVFSFYLPLYLAALCLSLIAREWVHQLYAPLVPFAYTTPIQLTSAAGSLAVWAAWQWDLLPEFMPPFGTLILLAVANLGALLAVLENLLYLKQATLRQYNELEQYKKLSPFGLVHIDHDDNIIYYNDLFAQWISSYQLPTPIQHWSQYFPRLDRRMVFENTHNNRPTEIKIKQLTIELPDGVNASFCLFGFAEKNYTILYLVPTNAHLALTLAAKLNNTLAEHLYTSQGLEEVFTRIEDSARSRHALPNFMAFLKIHIPHTLRSEPQDYSVPLSEALHRHLHHHTRTPFYIGKLSGQEFVIIMTRFSAERLNRRLAQFINHLQEDVLTRFSHTQHAARCHVGVVELGATLDYSGALAVARSACDHAIYNNEPATVYQQNTPELQLQIDQLHFFEQLDQGNTRGLFLLMQPIINLHTPADSYHVEVLLRFKNDENELLPTGALINLADQNGAITTIDKWVFTTALDWLSQHRAELTHIRWVNLNLSAVSLNSPEFIHDLIELLKRYPAILPKLCIEITESVALHDLAYTRNLMHTLQGMGIRIALDDFGAGYTSFSYLSELPANALKIDGSLIKDMLQTSSNTAIVRTIVELAQNLGMDSIAEWVEDIDTLLALKEIGVDYVQGFVVSEATHPTRILDHKEVFTLIADPVTVRYLQD
ncbi:MAG TPA: EAL domain-containing protein [Paenalcaligenes sp.]|nr:EAL domain-containing protein [Paenalcaligenes sp.]